MDIFFGVRAEVGKEQIVYLGADNILPERYGYKSTRPQ